MSINFDGATSGNREDGRPPKDPPYDKQIPQDTSSNTNDNPGVVFPCQTTGNREGIKDPPVPTCGTPDDSAV